MMAHTIHSTIGIFVILILSCSCNPVKRSTSQQASECYGTECVVDLDFPTHTEVLFPENLTQVVKTALPSIVDTQDKIVSLLHNHTVNQKDSQDKIVDLLQNHTVNQKDSQDKIVDLLRIQNQTSVFDAILQNQKDIQQQTVQHLDNMTATLTYLFENVANLLQAQLAIMKPRDCAGIAAQGHNISKPYIITPDYSSHFFTVYCDLETDGGGWTVFQRRFDGSEDFFRGWQDYENGFGNPYGEYWVGLRLLHQLTKTGTWELLVELEDFNGNTAYAHYSSFQIGDAASYYRLSIANYTGTAGDSLKRHNNQFFSTMDQESSSRACAEERKGAWWYAGCTDSNLNGLYLGHSGNSWSGMVWHHWKLLRSLKKSSMKIRRIY